MTEVRLERVVAATPQRVFDAWTDPAVMRRWYCPNPDMHLEVTGDAVVGGAFRVDMGHGAHVVEGVWTDLEPGRLVAFTWRWTTSEVPASRVRVELTPEGDGTRLVLTHTGLADDDDARGHAEGWQLQLARLDGLDLAAA